MSHFRKKPVIVEAKQLTNDTMWEVWHWIGDAADEWCWDDPNKPGAERYIAIRTLEGTMRAKDGDWVVKGVKGEFYPVKPDIFALTHEDVEAVEPARPTPAFVLGFEAAAASQHRLRSALDHIRRVAKASRTGTRRLQWIESRAASALEGNENWRALDLPKSQKRSTNTAVAIPAQQAWMIMVLRARYENFRFREQALMYDVAFMARGMRAAEERAAAAHALLLECYEWLFESKADGPRVSEGGEEYFSPAFAALLRRLRHVLPARTHRAESQEETP